MGSTELRVEGVIMDVEVEVEMDVNVEEEEIGGLKVDVMIAGWRGEHL